MTTLRLALLADGAGDRALLPILSWTVRAVAPDTRFFEPDFEVRRGTLATEVSRVLFVARPNILFVHRDAEREPLEVRRGEIPSIGSGLVRVVPVRMTEAWLLIDAAAIRNAAGNPKGMAELELPRLAKLESLPDPKALLRQLLLDASGHVSPRRRERFQRDLQRRVHLVAEHVRDFSPLRGLPAFQAFESDLRQALRSPRDADGG